MTTSVPPAGGQADVTPEIDRRAALIASLRSLANLIEDIPQLPLMDQEISWVVGGPDAEAVPAIKSLCNALAGEGVSFALDEEPSHAISVNIPLVGGHVARAFHVYERSLAEYRARTSYHRVVQVDAEQDGQVAS
jgi:hypothetical protein